MSDAQKAPAPSETERAVEVAKGLTEARAEALLRQHPSEYRSSYDTGSHLNTLRSLRRRGLLKEHGGQEFGALMMPRTKVRYALTPFGRLVARSLKGEG